MKRKEKKSLKQESEAQSQAVKHKFTIEFAASSAFKISCRYHWFLLCKKRNKCYNRKVNSKVKLSFRAIRHH